MRSEAGDILLCLMRFTTNVDLPEPELAETRNDEVWKNSFCIGTSILGHSRLKSKQTMALSRKELYKGNITSCSGILWYSFSTITVAMRTPCDKQR